MRWLLACLALLAALTGAPAVAQDYPARPNGPVYDGANVISPGEEQLLNQRLSDYTRTTGRAVIVATVPSLDGLEIEQYAQGLAEKWDIGGKDESGNVAHGDVCMVDTRNALVIAQSRLVACVGLEDVVVVETPDAVMVARKDCAQQVKEVVARLRQDGRKECLNHRKVYRPWGSYDGIDCGPRFQVKRITVKPGAALSLQMHHHRAEHWIVVKGTAEVTRGQEVFLLSENQSTYIPIGEVHRLHNPGKMELEMIEVQSGAYLGEDDIVRLEDVYGREPKPQ